MTLHELKQQLEDGGGELHFRTSDFHAYRMPGRDVLIHDLGEWGMHVYVEADPEDAVRAGTLQSEELEELGRRASCHF